MLSVYCFQSAEKNGDLQLAEVLSPILQDQDDDNEEEEEDSGVSLEQDVEVV